MLDGKKVLGLITARGGSKGLPGKNIKPICGFPLIYWSILAAKESRFIDDLVVSTDSQAIADCAAGFGAEVPFLRPPELASDTASSIDAVLHAIDHLARLGRHYDYLVLLEPTSPLREATDIDQALEKLNVTAEAESIVGVCRVEGAHPDFLVTLGTQFLVPYTGFFEAKRRQDLSDCYFFEGTVYISKIPELRRRRAFYHQKCLAHVVPKWKSFEIDDAVDFAVVERLLELREIDSPLLE